VAKPQFIQKRASYHQANLSAVGVQVSAHSGWCQGLFIGMVMALQALYEFLWFNGLKVV